MIKYFAFGWTNVVGLLVLLFPTMATAQKKVCWMVYQIADNNLEQYIREDFREITFVPVLDDLVTWIYYDHGGGSDTPPLPNVYDANGNALTSKPTTSQIITYNSDIGQMRLVETTASEQDSEDPAVLQSFMERALQDCLAQGTTETFLVLSGHGGGFYGYGGDDQDRRLAQTNSNLASGMAAALATVGLDKLDVLGFDACLMQAVGTLDDYREVARYLLASEATEPGHGA